MDVEKLTDTLRKRHKVLSALLQKPPVNVKVKASSTRNTFWIGIGNADERQGTNVNVESLLLSEKDAAGKKRKTRKGEAETTKEKDGDKFDDFSDVDEDDEALGFTFVGLNRKLLAEECRTSESVKFVKDALKQALEDNEMEEGASRIVMEDIGESSAFYTAKANSLRKASKGKSGEHDGGDKRRIAKGDKEAFGTKNQQPTKSSRKKKGTARVQNLKKDKTGVSRIAVEEFTESTSPKTRDNPPQPRIASKEKICEYDGVDIKSNANADKKSSETTNQHNMKFSGRKKKRAMKKVAARRKKLKMAAEGASRIVCMEEIGESVSLSTKAVDNPPEPMSKEKSSAVSADDGGGDNKSNANADKEFSETANQQLTKSNGKKKTRATKKRAAVRRKKLKKATEGDGASRIVMEEIGESASSPKARDIPSETEGNEKSCEGGDNESNVSDDKEFSGTKNQQPTKSSGKKRVKKKKKAEARGEKQLETDEAEASTVTVKPGTSRKKRRKDKPEDSKNKAEAREKRRQLKIEKAEAREKRKQLIKKKAEHLKTLQNCMNELMMERLEHFQVDGKVNDSDISDPRYKMLFEDGCANDTRFLVTVELMKYLAWLQQKLQTHQNEFYYATKQPKEDKVSDSKKSTSQHPAESSSSAIKTEIKSYHSKEGERERQTSERLEGDSLDEFYALLQSFDEPSPQKSPTKRCSTRQSQKLTSEKDPEPESILGLDYGPLRSRSPSPVECRQHAGSSKSKTKHFVQPVPPPLDSATLKKQFDSLNEELEELINKRQRVMEGDTPLDLYSLLDDLEMPELDFMHQVFGSSSFFS